MLGWEEFKTFLFIYLANADFDFSVKEENYIKVGIDKNTYLNQLDLFYSFSDLQAFNFILEHKSLYFDTEAKKEEVLQEVKNFFEIDGDYSILEKELFMVFFKMM